MIDAPLPPLRPRPPRRTALLALAATALAACGSQRDEGAARNVLVVLVDTLRADKLGCYGNPRGLSPRMDRLAAEGVLFENASSHAPWTLPSTASLLTSLYPHQHGAGGQVPDFTRLARGVDGMAGVFGRAGYATTAIVNVAFLGKEFGLGRGFEHVDAKYFDNNLRLRRAERTTEAALEWLDVRFKGRPFFLLVHYFDPHAVYDPPQPFRARFAAPQDREDESFVFGTREHMMALRSGALELDPDVVRRAEALYDGEVAYTDEHVGRLLDGLAERGLDSSTVVVLTADHGEEFLDHGGFEHGHSLYAELCHVPLIVRAPGLSPARVGQGVGHVDVAPTVAALAGVAPSRKWAGESLLPLVQDPLAPDRDVLAHGNFWGPPLTSWRDAELKLILSGEREPARLYRWRSDPTEQTDLAAEKPGLVRGATGKLRQFQRGTAASGARGQEVELTPERVRELESLGYVEGEPGGDG